MIKSTFIPRASCLDASNSMHACSATVEYPIVLLHGWGCDSRIWQSLMPFLNTCADIILVDIEYSYKNSEECCKAIERVLPDKSILLGWSLGGMLATRVASMYPTKVHALVTLASNVSFVADDNWADAMLPDTFASFFKVFTANAQKALTRFSLLQVQDDAHSKQQLHYLKPCLSDSDYLKAGLDYLQEMNNLEYLTNKIVCPSLYVFGENDSLVPVAAAHELDRLLKARQLEKNQHVAVINHKGHVLPCVDNTSDLLTILTDFLKSLQRAV